MLRVRSVIVAGFSLVTLAACGDPSGPTTEPTGAGLGEQLDAARERWSAAEITDYELTTKVFCFCPELPSVRVRVTNGEVVSSEQVGGEIDVGNDPRTVESWFDEIERLLAGNADHVDVHFDPATGRPLTMSVDPIESAVDDEYAVQTVSFYAGDEIPVPVDLSTLDPATLTSTWGCGYGFHVSNAAQTVALSFTYVGAEPLPVGAAAVATVLPHPDWTVELWVGRDLMANWCDDVPEPGEPVRVLDSTWVASAGSIGALVVPSADGVATIRLEGLVFSGPGGAQLDLGTIEVANGEWGRFAG
jgi:hypothetical protein